MHWPRHRMHCVEFRSCSQGAQRCGQTNASQLIGKAPLHAVAIVASRACGPSTLRSARLAAHPAAAALRPGEVLRHVRHSRSRTSTASKPNQNAHRPGARLELPPGSARSRAGLRLVANQRQSICLITPRRRQLPRQLLRAHPCSADRERGHPRRRGLRACRPRPATFFL